MKVMKVTQQIMDIEPISRDSKAPSKSLAQFYNKSLKDMNQSLQLEKETIKINIANTLSWQVSGL